MIFLLIKSEMSNSRNRHCEEGFSPTQQSKNKNMDCFASLAMTVEN